MKKYLIYILGGVVGALGGYLYYVNWGCTNGCPLQSSAPIMTGYGALVGLLVVSGVFDFVLAKRKNREEQKD